MKLSYTITLLASVLLCVSASATPITWNNIPSPNMPTPNFNPPTISFTPIGPSTYGSDGSRATTVDNTTITNNGVTIQTDGDGNHAVGSDGSRGVIIGDTVYVTRKDGSQFYCRQQGSQSVCHPR